MNTAKNKLLKLIDEIPENQIAEVIDFISYLKSKREKALTEDFQIASVSSLDFWDNDTDDEVWNNV